jgi:hypothetical protein
LLIDKTAFNNEYHINCGYNKIELSTPVKVKKGNMILLNNVKYLYGLISVDTTGDATYSDYYRVPYSNTLLKLNNAKNYRIFFQANIDDVYYLSRFKAIQAYENFGSYTFKVNFNNPKGANFSSSSISFTNSKFL